MNHPPHTSTGTQRLHYGWVLLVFGVLAVFCALGLARFGYTLILPPMKEGLSLNDTEAGALATGNFIGYLALALVGGALASRFGPRRLITLSLAVAGAGMILTATVRGFSDAVAWRTFTGMGSGGSNVPMMGLLAAWFARSRRGLATGIAVSGSSFGLIVTGALVPSLLDAGGTEGWRLAWIVLGGMVVAIGILCGVFLRDRPEEKNLLPVGHVVDEVAAGPSSEPPPAAVSTLSWRRVYRSTAVWHLALIYTTFGFSYIIFVTFFARYLQGERGYSKEATGALWVVIGWLSIFCGVLWGWVSDVAGRKYGLAIVSVIQATAYAVFALSQTGTGVWIAVVLFGITAWSIPAIMAAACGDHVGSRMAPAALGLATLVFGIGQALGPVVAGRISDATGSFGGAFLAAAGVALAGAVASLLLHRAH